MVGHLATVEDLESDHECDHWGLAECVDHLVPWACLPKMELLLEKVDVRDLSEKQVNELRYYDYHSFPEISPMISITFLHGKSAVRIINGIRDDEWTVDEVKAELKRYRARRKDDLLDPVGGLAH